MRVTVRGYDHATDFDRVGRFLVRTFRSGGSHVNWQQPRWEYMHFHPLIAGVDRGAIGVWEAKGAVVAVVHPEHRMGEAFFEVDPLFAHLKPEMLAHAEEKLAAVTDGRSTLTILVDDRDLEMQRIAGERGYARGAGGESMSRLEIPDPFPPIALPDGFRLRSLAEGNDLRRVHRVLWRGFDHGPEPPDDGLEERRFMQSAPNYDRGLQIVVEAPDGNFVSYCGIWFEPMHRIAYVEPVATDPDYRRMGLGRAAVLEGVRRGGRRGATAAYVGTDTVFYRSLGFRPVDRYSAWRREWSHA